MSHLLSRLALAAAVGDEELRLLNTGRLGNIRALYATRTLDEEHRQGAEAALREARRLLPSWASCGDHPVGLSADSTLRGSKEPSSLGNRAALEAVACATRPFRGPGRAASARLVGAPLSGELRVRARSAARLIENRCCLLTRGT